MGWMPLPKDKDWLNGYKNKTSVYAVYQRPTSKQGTHTAWKWRARKKKTFHANGDQKKAGVTILISDKIDFKIKVVKRDKEGHYIMIKGSIQEEDILWNSAFKWYIFPFLLCLACLVFSQLFLRPPQRTILPFCISFSWGWSWSCYLYNITNLSPKFFRHSIYQI